MAGREKRRKLGGLSVAETAAGMLADALKGGCDFIITFGMGDDGEQCVHLMTGPLITPCMLGTLSNRCDMPEPGGCRHVMVRCEGKGTRKKPGN